MADLEKLSEIFTAVMAQQGIDGYSLTDLPKDTRTDEQRIKECEAEIERKKTEPPAYSSKQYDCAVCGNRGEVYHIEKFETPVRNLYRVLSRPCECMRIRKEIERLERCGVFANFSKCTFDNFETKIEWQKKLKERAEQFIADDEAKVLFVGGQSGCVDCDTEYFNGSEWKRIADYQGENVLAYDAETGNAVLCAPERYIKKAADTLYSIKTSRGSINQVLSADHNFAYVTSKGHMQKKPFIEVKRMHEASIQGFHGLVQTTFEYNGKGIDLTDAEIRLMCAVIADGSFPKRQQQCAVNVKKERKKERMRKLLADCNLQYKEYTRLDGYSRFRFYAPRKEKVFSPDWYNCTSEQLKVIADEVFYWDGSTDGTRKRFFSTEKRNADFVQFALAASGKRATISVDTHRKKPCYTVLSASGKPYVSMLSPKGKNKAQIQEYKPTDGKMYCFTVNTGYLVLRRDGRIFITGNSGKTHICTAVLVQLMRKQSGRYMSWVETVKKLKANATDSEASDDIMIPLKSVAVLYIDDFLKPVKDNTGRVIAATPADIRIAYEIINYRYNRGLRTIITSECYITEIMDIDEAVGGRIAEMATEKYLLHIEAKPENNYRRRAISYL